MDLTYFIKELSLIVPTAAKLFCSERTGGYFCLAYKSGIPALVAEIGEMDEEKRRKYYTFAKEKAFRLSVTHSFKTSWQSRNPQEDKWGGAISSLDWIFSFSGFPELVDEAMMFVLAVRGRFIDLEEIQCLIAISDNHFFWPLFNELKEKTN